MHIRRLHGPVLRDTTQGKEGKSSAWNGDIVSKMGRDFGGTINVVPVKLCPPSNRYGRIPVSAGITCCQMASWRPGSHGWRTGRKAEVAGARRAQATVHVTAGYACENQDMIPGYCGRTQFHRHNTKKRAPPCGDSILNLAFSRPMGSFSWDPVIRSRLVSRFGRKILAFPLPPSMSCSDPTSLHPSDRHFLMKTPWPS